jgi:hypothetical protein
MSFRLLPEQLELEFWFLHRDSQSFFLILIVLIRDTQSVLFLMFQVGFWSYASSFKIYTEIPKAILSRCFGIDCIK